MRLNLIVYFDDIIMICHRVKKNLLQKTIHFFIFQTIKIKGTIIKNWQKNLALFIYGGKEEKIAGVKIEERK